MIFFALEGKYPAVLREDGKAFFWSNTREAWSEMSARELLSDTRTDELTASEFETDLVVASYRRPLQPSRPVTRWDRPRR